MSIKRMDILLYMLLDLRKGLCRKIASVVVLELWNRVTIGLSSVRGLLVNLFLSFLEAGTESSKFLKL